MQIEKISLNEQVFTLYIQYQSDDNLRKEFNKLKNEVWEFDFENYYESGFWDDNCIIYSLFHDNQIVAHTTVSTLETIAGNEHIVLAQLGMVMTRPDYQKQGLSRYLMERIQQDYKEKVNGMFLFANDSVLDFYPKFNFSPVHEFQASAQIKFSASSHLVTKLNLDDFDQRKLLESYANNSIPTSSLYSKNFGLTFFYCYAYPDFGFKDAVYYIESLKTIAIAQKEENTLTILQLFQMEQQNLDNIIHALATPEIDTVVFGFSPLNTDFNYTIHKEEDLTLFVSAELTELFNKQKLMIPLLSHT
ncbi:MULTISPECIES: GNAT family N-acetyltransferase [unclassified Sphingobacterium]|uniref:GNAT family N-acetyltransferase n=1 Tax=unclassified Sphingobacterium TaxID=2609468 RepID=UPI0010447731|nr:MULTISPECIES: GNAT family N-acetyltransferase [unclassified Sphingobacterium]MCS3554722.1 putative N-acetyltransferase YhbS [Sphingobacterium sp. JUb21]TCR07710.1 acetyltransferase (GNAT) family protein [Sphingobacterium sp. JUb20]